MLKSLNDCPVILCLMPFLKGYIVLPFWFFFFYMTPNHRKCCYIRWDLHTIYQVHLNSLQCVLSGSCCSMLFDTAFLNIGEGGQNCFYMVLIMVLNVGSISKGTNQNLTRASGMLVSSTIMLLI